LNSLYRLPRAANGEVMKGSCGKRAASPGTLRRPKFTERKRFGDRFPPGSSTLGPIQPILVFCPHTSRVADESYASAIDCGLIAVGNSLAIIAVDSGPGTRPDNEFASINIR
jgi:Flp pilus assembly pilin Flp